VVVDLREAELEAIEIQASTLVSTNPPKLNSRIVVEGISRAHGPATRQAAFRPASVNASLSAPSIPPLGMPTKATLAPSRPNFRSHVARNPVCNAGNWSTRVIRFSESAQAPNGSSGRACKRSGYVEKHQRVDFGPVTRSTTSLT